MIYAFRETQNIIPQTLENKEHFFRDLMNIEHSWTGRMDIMFANTFIQEAVQLIVNSIVLFEKGYFDCAFYSLRQSLEISTSIVYLVDDKGFVDANNLNPFQKDDNAGPNNELGGTPYDYKPVTWSETYKNPGYKAGENGKPLPVNKNNDNKNDKKK